MRFGLLGLLGLAACAGQADAPVVAPLSTGWSQAEVAQLARMRLPDHLPPDPSSRWADDASAAALGRTLFHDAGLSPSGRFSCATCHDPAKHFTDGLPKAIAAGVAARNTPPLEGSQLGPWFFWDGRADSLWAQAAGPVEAAVEMGSDRVHVVRHVLDEHRDDYERVFGPAPTATDLARLPLHARPDDDVRTAVAVAWAGIAAADRDVVTGVFVRVLKAIAAYERTLLPSESAFDRYVDAVVAGDPHGGGALDPAQERGLRFFLRDGSCAACHHGPFLTDHAFHALGLPTTSYDPGRIVGAERVRGGELRCGSAWSDATSCDELRFLDPTFEDFRGAFKTPTLRNVTATAPYMHDGSLATLDAVLTFYAELPGDTTIGHRELTLRPLHLDAGQRSDLIAFLGALEAPVTPQGSAPTGLHARR